MKVDGEIKPLVETPSTKQNIRLMQIYTKNMKIPNPRATILSSQLFMNIIHNLIHTITISISTKVI
jgi:hypothetical protein